MLALDKTTKIRIKTARKLIKLAASLLGNIYHDVTQDALSDDMEYFVTELTCLNTDLKDLI